MDKKVFYCLPTYKSFDLAYDSVLAALRSTLVPDQIIIADNSTDGSGAAYLQSLVEKFNNVHIWPQTVNNLARTWNLFHTEIQSDYIIIANDDIQVDPYTIERLVSASEQKPNEILFAGDGLSGNAFSLFLLTHYGFNRVGKFDEHFDPAYFEDNDYARRALLLGYHINFVSGATYSHVGSSTLKRYTWQEMEKHHNAFRANEAYYIRKWGGKPHEEVFETEFDQ